MSPLARLNIAVAAVTALLLLPTYPTHADPARTRAARRAFNRAEVQYRLGNFVKALAHYKEALKLARRPSIVFNIAQCHRFLEQRKKAIFFYELYLSEWKRTHPDAPPPNREEVRQWISTLKREIAEAEPGRVQLLGVPDGAAVLIDGKLVGRGPLAAPFELERGEHALRVEAQGYHPFDGTLEVRGGTSVIERVKLRRLRGRTKAWLATGIVGTTLAVGAEVAALLLTRETNKRYDDTPEFRRYRNGAIASHIAAGILATAAAVSFVLYFRSGERAPAMSTVSFTPVRSGAMIAAQGIF